MVLSKLLNFFFSVFLSKTRSESKSCFWHSLPIAVSRLKMLLAFLICLNFGNLKASTHELEAKNQFLLYELAKLNEKIRQQGLEEFEKDTQQTLDSFDYQWEHLPSGLGMPDDQGFMSNLKNQICKMTGHSASWFKGKKVIDIGCGLGRFSYGLLLLGAQVTACDASLSALKRTQELCSKQSDRLHLFQANIIKDSLPNEEFDLAFCFGVVHHTGNTYLAIKKVCDTVKSGGRVFIMVYGYPVMPGDFDELNSYEALREELRPLNFDEKIKLLRQRLPANQVHGFFDAASPKINDLMKFGELVEVLESFGIKNVTRSLPNRNLYVHGDKSASR